MKYFVTGARGFVGSHLIRRLRKENHEVVEADLYDCDVTNFVDVVGQMEGDVVVHLAARVRAGQSLKKPYQYMETNVVGLLNVLESMRIRRIPRIIFFSSIGARYYEDDGSSPYLWTKKFGEMLIKMYSQLYGIEGIIFRPTNIYGKSNNKGIIHIFLQANKHGKTLQIHGGSQTRDFIHVNDVVDAVIRATKLDPLPKPYMIMELGTGIETSIKQLADLISEDQIIIPAPKIDIGLKRSVAYIEDIQHTLQWEPKVILEKGLERLKEEYA